MRDLAGVGVVQPGDQVQQRALAAAGLAGQRDAFAGRDLKIDAAQHRQRRGRQLVALAKAGDFQHRPRQQPAERTGKRCLKRVQALAAVTSQIEPPSGTRVALHERCQRLADRRGGGGDLVGRLAVEGAAGRADLERGLHRGIEALARGHIHREIVPLERDRCKPGFAQESGGRAPRRRTQTGRDPQGPAAASSARAGRRPAAAPSARDCRAACASRRTPGAPPGRSALRMLANDSAGSAKNITPKRETSRSKLAGANGMHGRVGKREFHRRLRRRDLARPRQHRRRDIDAEHTPGRADLVGERKGGGAATATDVEHALAGLDVRPRRSGSR